jgi:hypothetical protein
MHLASYELLRFTDQTPLQTKLCSQQRPHETSSARPRGCCPHPRHSLDTRLSWWLNHWRCRCHQTRGQREVSADG